MTDAFRAYFDQQEQEFDQAVRNAIAACDGDLATVLRAAVIANTFLIEENERLCLRNYLRTELFPRKLARPASKGANRFLLRILRGDLRSNVVADLTDLSP